MSAQKMRIYLETSIISYLDAPDTPEKMKDNWRLWDDVKIEKYEVVISDTTLYEINNCPRPAKKELMNNELKSIHYELLDLNDEVKNLASAYISIGGLPPKCRIDALHIAAATLANCDVILSWNFRHIVNLKAMIAVEAVNAREMLRQIKILSPTIFLGE